MENNIDDVREDLAYIKSVLEEHKPAMTNSGILYCAAGIFYGLQCVIIGGSLAGYYAMEGFVVFAAGVMPTLLFFAVLFWVMIRNRKSLALKGTVARAMGAAFGGAGLANLVLALIFAVASAQRGDFSIWLFFPVTVCALQGAVWYAVAIVRRRWWMGGVAAGWFATAVAAGLAVQNPAQYNLVLGVGLFAFMALPGYAMMRIGKRSA